MFIIMCDKWLGEQLYMHSMKGSVVQLTNGKGEGGYAVKSNPSGFPVGILDKDADDTTRTLNVDLCLWFYCGFTTAVDEVPAEGYDRVATHGTVSLVMQEQHSDVRLLWSVGRDEKRPVHVEVATRLQDKEPAEVVEMVTQVTPFLEQRSAEDLGVAGLNDP